MHWSSSILEAISTTSSAKAMWFNLRASINLTLPSSFLRQVSRTRLKRNGDKGSPCLTPRATDTGLDTSEPAIILVVLDE